jgi:hypothetical protein
MTGNPAWHFGKQVKKERLARGWGLDELAKETGISVAHWSRIENGKRPPTETVARASDKAFSERKGWFTEYYFDLQTWAEVPSWFKPWSEHEMSTTTIRAWSPSNVHGLLQTEGYATAQISLHPGITPEKIAEHVANRMARQKRVLHRDDPPLAHFLVDLDSLRRMPPVLMRPQLRRLLAVARLPHVTIQVVPECWHSGLTGGFVLTDSAAYAESAVTGQVYADPETVSSLARRFDSVRTEAMRASESVALITEMSGHERLAQVQLLKRQRRRLRGDRQW